MTFKSLKIPFLTTEVFATDRFKGRGITVLSVVSAGAPTILPIHWSHKWTELNKLRFLKSKVINLGK